MNPERWAWVKRVFDAALDRDPAQREDFVAVECGDDAALAAEVRSLLAADAREASAVPLVDVSSVARPLALEPVGDLIAGFRILRQIGAGGMGKVYEAQQQRPLRIVAWKTLASGFSSDRARRRFEDEADILARLRHPAIAQVFEAGTWRAGGVELPWFAMELVEDPRPIDRHAREERLAVRAIAELFRSVCDAIHYAHQRGVIHRDLKPANVLVDRHGKPKVIDFGIARVSDSSDLARLTRTGEILGTLAYMSPERLEAGGDADDTAADVYALGVMLYELLAERSPFPIEGLPPARVVDLLRTSDPPPPSRAAGVRLVPVELDWITQKAMARSAARRYASAGELAGDLERYLRDEPVMAGPPSATYRLRKLARRHRVLLLVAALAFVAISIGLVIAALGWRRVAEAERYARREAATLQQVNEFQQRILRGAYGSARGKDTRLADVVDAAAKDLENSHFTDPLVEVGARNSMAASFLALGRLDEAERHLLRARAVLTGLGIENHADLRITVASNLAVCYETMGKLDLSEREARSSLADRLAAFGPDHPQSATAQSNLASLLLKRSSLAEALDLATAAWRTFERKSGAGSEQVITTRTYVGQALAGMGRSSEADAMFEATAALAAEHLPADHPARLGVAIARADHLHKRGNIEEYVRACGEIAATRERLDGPTHPNTLTAWNNLAAGHLERGDHAAAEATFRRIVAARAAAGIQDGFDVVVTGQNLTVAVRRQGRAGEAEAMARSLRETAQRSLPADHWLIGVVTKELGGCLRDLARYEEAEPVLLAAEELLERSLGTSDYRTQKVIGELVALYEVWPKTAEAVKWAAKKAQR